MVTLKIGSTGVEEVTEALEKKQRVLDDLRPFFKSIASDFYKSNEPLIFRESPGRYEDLKPRTKRRKDRRFDRHYPVLVATGRLRDSLSEEPTKDRLLLIKKHKLEMGTKVPYGKFHQSGVPSRNLPARPFLLLDVDRRVERWVRILEAGFID